jgi:xanthine dehydrogenase accessory factor
VARALTGLAPRIGLQTVLVAEGALASDFPDAARVVGSDRTDAVAQALPSGGLVVVATQGRRDLPALRAALALQPQTLWFVASERKAGVLRESLVGAGEDPARVAAIVAPAGEPIGAQTPEEIALAVLATVVAARRGRPVRAATPAPTATEKPAPKFKLDLPPMEMGSCCGGGAAKAADAESVSEVAPPVVAAKSCCGGN